LGTSSTPAACRVLPTQDDHREAEALICGTYRVIEIISDVAVRLELPLGARLHDVFHVGMLKKFIGAPPALPPALSAIHNGVVIPEPLRVEQARLARGVRQVLVRWRGEPAESASWEDLDEFRIKYPDFQLEDELGLEGGERCPVTCAAPPNAQRARRRRPPRVAKFGKREISFYFYSLSLGEIG
jgi:hypothetical protein